MYNIVIKCGKATL